MSLLLDARQRAMLHEMGVTVWAPAAPAEPPVLAPATAAVHPPPTSATSLPPAAASPQPPASQAVPERSGSASRPAAPGASELYGTPRSPAGAASATSLQLHAAQALYPTADPAEVPTELGAGWLIVAESTTPHDPLAGDVGKLLDNMLRAMQLHRHPRTYLAALERLGPGSTAAPGIAAELADMVAALQPSMVIVLGHLAARTVLGRTEPLGRLRAGPHLLGGQPAIVTYDPAFLLRSQENKAAAWADLCHALAMVRRAATPSAD